MVAMNVSADNRVDRVVVDAERFERDEAGGAEVKREAYAGNVDQNAGVETASGSERVSASDEGDLCGQGDLSPVSTPTARPVEQL